MAKQDISIGSMIIDGDLYSIVGVAEFNHIIREVPYNVELFVKKIHEIVFSTNNGKAPAVFHKMRFALGTENMRLIQPLCDSALWE